jgi:hypothetical protein
MDSGSDADFAVLGAELETALVRELLATWRQLNHSHFRGRLEPPTIGLTGGTTRLGLWLRSSREILLSRPFVVDQPWGAVVEVLKHEMAHQYVHEVLNVLDESAHGPAFRELCARLGIDGAAAGLPASAAGGADGVGDPAAEPRLLARVAKLLALAESPNVHEAQSAMAEAQRLMLRYNLEAPRTSRYGFRHLGTPTGRISTAEKLIGTILAEHFFVEVIYVPVWRPREGKRGTVLEICGTSENLALAEYVHAFLGHTAERFWRDYRRTRGLRRDAERRTFLAGVMLGFREKLAAQRTRHAEEGLVWVGDGDLHRYYRQRHPHIRHTQGSGVRRTEAHFHGREAGRTIVLHRPVEAADRGAARRLGAASAGASGSGQRLLGPGRG